MHLKVEKISALAGHITCPTSKSQSIRALFMALLAKGESRITHLLDCEDTRDALRVCQAFGAEIQQPTADQWLIKSHGPPFDFTGGRLYTGNSGITTRFALPLIGLRKQSSLPIQFDCGTQMRQRPMKPLLDALLSLGLTIQPSESTALPVTLSGKLRGGSTRVSGEASQYLSALLFALPHAAHHSELIIENLHARPYVRMTEQWLERTGIQFSHQRKEDTDYYAIPGGQEARPFRTTITGDFSSAACLLVAAALTDSDVIIDGLDFSEPQSDKRLISILLDMGADITLHARGLHIRGGRPLQGIRIDLQNSPDLLPALAVLGTQARGKTEIFNVAQARYKETDRIHAMARELTRMGATLTEHPDGLTLRQSTLHGTHVHGYHDHRTIMALVVAGMLAKQTTWIDTAESINKTFPTFFTTLQQLGAQIT